jgi:hypothetical protein
MKGFEKEQASRRERDQKSYQPSSEKLKELSPDDQGETKMDAWDDLIKALTVFGRAGGTRQEAFETVRNCIEYRETFTPASEKFPR